MLGFEYTVVFGSFDCVVNCARRNCATSSELKAGLPGFLFFSLDSVRGARPLATLSDVATGVALDLLPLMDRPVESEVWR